MQNFNIEYATELQDQEILRAPFEVILDLTIKLAELSSQEAETTQTATL